MADEQTIYHISQDEELTNVRERLEKAPARNITLVVPSHEKLRSHIGWRVLHARARALDKEVLVVSPDRQIRAVAKAAGFRIAEPLETPSSSKSRLSSRSTRTAMSARSAPQTRGTPRGTPESRISRQRNKPSRQYDLQVEQPERTTETPPNTSPLSEKSTTPPSATFEPPERQFGQDIEYLIDTSPSIRPFVPHHEDEEPDLLSEDFYQAQRIREAAQQQEPGRMQDLGVQPRPLPDTSRGTSQTAHATYIPDEEEDDPFANMEDYRSSPLPEQLGSAPMEEIDPGVPDIPEVSTDVLADSEIEDLGDQGDIVQANRSWTPTSDIPLVDDDLEEPYEPRPSRIYGTRQGQNRTGSTFRTPLENSDDEDRQVPLPDQPTRIIAPSSARPSGSLSPAGSMRAPNPIVPPKRQESMAQPVPTQPRSQTKKPPTKAPVTSRRVAPPPARSMLKPAPAPKYEGRRTAIVILCILLFFVLVGTLAYFGPSATVTITVPAQSVSVTSLKFTTISTSKQNAATVPAETLTYATKYSGTGSSSSSQPSNTATASGSVIFTNNNSTLQIDIPTGTIISTQTGVQFTTDADILVLPNSTFPVPVHAQQSGPSGNVSANSITVIPSASISAIEKSPNNNGITIPPDSLKVNNPDATSGGGTGTIPVIAASDVMHLQKQLEQQVLTSQPFKDWLSKNVHTGDVMGQFPAPKDSITTTPQAGQKIPDGKFKGTLDYHLTFLVVRAATIQTATRDEFNLAIKKQHPGYSLVPGQSFQSGSVQNTSPKDGKSVTFSLGQTTGVIAPIESNSALASLLVREPIDQAKGEIKSVLGLHNVEDPTINITPGFFPSMPFRAENIHISFKPVLTPSTPPKKGVPKKK